MRKEVHDQERTPEQQLAEAYCWFLAVTWSVAKRRLSPFGTELRSALDHLAGVLADVQGLDAEGKTAEEVAAEASSLAELRALEAAQEDEDGEDQEGT